MKIQLNALFSIHSMFNIDRFLKEKYYFTKIFS